jgi:hypothetical protein
MHAQQKGNGEQDNGTMAQWAMGQRGPGLVVPARPTVYGRQGYFGRLSRPRLVAYSHLTGQLDVGTTFYPGRFNPLHHSDTGW